MNDTNKHGVIDFLEPLIGELEGIVHIDTMNVLRIHQKEIERRCKHRGLSLLMISLPKIGKIYDKGLSSGFIDFEALRKDSQIAFKGGFLLEPLLLQSFSSNGRLIEPEPILVTLTRSILYAFKKVKLDCPSSVVRKFHHDFFDLDGILRRPTLYWGTKDPSSEVQLHNARSLSFCSGIPRSSKRLNQLAAMLDVVRYYLCPSRAFEVTDVVGRHGPGAVADLASGNDKYSFPNWPARLSSVFPPGYMITSWGESERDVPDSWGNDLPSKLIAVPKTIDKPRLIASEPTANMWCQQALLGWIRKNTSFAQLFVNFHDQTPSRDLALQASQTGSLATVDLRSASDLLSCWTVERMFASNISFLKALLASRTTSVTSEVVGKSLLEMRKYAPQGNATTFPIQSIVYTAVAITATLYDRGLSVTPENIRSLVGCVRVFGDDIILPSTAVVYLDLILAHLELQINGDKTHHLGHFRESCGMDAYRGVDVTPVYLSSPKSSPMTPSELVSWCAIVNNARQAGLTRLAYRLEEAIPARLSKFIPRSYKPQAGVWILSLPDRVELDPKARVRWNKELQRHEYKGLVPITKVERGDRENYLNLLQWFTECIPSQGLTLRRNGTWAVLDSRSSVGYFSSKECKVLHSWVPLSD